MSFPVAMIPFVNMAPYRELGTPEGCRFVSCIPSKSIEALLKGDVIAAAVPVGGLPKLKQVVTCLGSFGIAAKQKSLSVLFFSNRPFESIKAPLKIFVTDKSASSVRLLYLLFGYKHGFDCLPYQTKNIKNACGELIIGDKALVKSLKLHCNEDKISSDNKRIYITDLATKWYVKNKLPFVFARWVIRKDAPCKVRKAIESWLAKFKNNEPELVKRAVLKAARTINVSPKDIYKYFQAIRRTLDDEDLKGQELFLSEVGKKVKEPLFVLKE